MAHAEDVLTVDTVIEAWTSEADRRARRDPERARRSRAFTDAALKILARGEPVTLAELARELGRAEEEVRAMFAAIGDQGGEIDDDGRLVGLALTLRPTAHRIHLDSRSLYAWCSLDTIFLPGLLGETAVVESTCPVTGALVRLTVAPDGVLDFTPEGLVLSITVPGISCRRADDPADKPKTGPASDSCRQMHFFTDRAAGERWLVDHPGVVLFTPDEAFRLARANWLSRRRTTASSSQPDDARPLSTDGGEKCCC